MAAYMARQSTGYSGIPAFLSPGDAAQQNIHLLRDSKHNRDQTEAKNQAAARATAIDRMKRGILPNIYGLLNCRVGLDALSLPVSSTKAASCCCPGHGANVKLEDLRTVFDGVMRNFPMLIKHKIESFTNALQPNPTQAANKKLVADEDGKARTG